MNLTFFPRLFYADNTILNVGSAGDTIRDKDRSGVKTQIIALDLNPAGAETLMAGVMPVADSLGNSTNSAGTGFLKVTDEPVQIFYDSFDAALDTTNQWTSTQGSSGVAAAVALGVLSMGTGTVANGYSKLISIPTFKPVIPGWLVFSDAIAFPDGAAPIANSYRFWGSGTTPATPTVAAPVTDGYGFELYTDGKLRAVVYAGGTRTIIADLSSSGTNVQPLNASYHRWIIQVRTDKTYFFIDSIASSGLVATTNFQSSQAQILPKLFLAIGGPTPPVSNVQIQSSGAVVSDTGKNTTQISDGTFPWRKLLINSSGAASVTANNPVNTTVSGTYTTGDIVVPAPAGDGLPVSGTPTAGSVIWLTVPDGYQSATFLFKGFATGACYIEGSTNTTNGSDGDWGAIKVIPLGWNATSSGQDTGTFALTQNGYYRGNVSAFKAIRGRNTGTPSSTTMLITLSTGASTTEITDALPVGINLIGGVNIAKVNSQFVNTGTGSALGGTLRVALSTDSVITVNTQSITKATYRSSTTAVLVTAVTSPNPWFTFYGSASKTIKIQSIIVSGLTLTAVAYLNMGLRKYSTAVSGGTSTALTKVPLDSTSAAGTATNVNVYTVAPTAGTTVGDLTSRRIIGQATTAAAAGIPQVVDFDFSSTEGTATILRGVAEGIGLYWITAPATAVSMLLKIEWTEE